MRLRAVLLTVTLCAFAAVVAFVPWYRPEPTSAADSGPQMAFRASGAVSCDAPSQPTECDATGPFTLIVDAIGLPGGGYEGFQTEIFHAGLTYTATGTCPEEVVWPGLDESICVRGTGGGGQAQHGGLTGLLPPRPKSNHVGDLLELDLECSGEGTFRVSLTAYASSSLGAAYVDTDGLLTAVKTVGSESLDLDGDTTPESVDVADVLDIQCAAPPQMALSLSGSVSCDAPSQPTECAAIGTFTLSVETIEIPDTGYGGMQTEVFHTGLTRNVAKSCPEEVVWPDQDGGFCVRGTGGGGQAQHAALTDPIPPLLKSNFVGSLVELSLECDTPGTFRVALTAYPSSSFGASYYDLDAIPGTVKTVGTESLDLDGDTTPESVDVADVLDINCGFVVDDTGDTADDNIGDGLCEDASGNCTLRAAIQEANDDTDRDLIGFDIAGAGPHTIQPATALPNIAEPLEIDATTEPDYVSTPVIELDGSSTSFETGLHIAAVNTTVRGFAINRFDTGIILDNDDAVIEANFIGTDPSGTVALGNVRGLRTFSSNSTIGGTTASARNVISGNTDVGVQFGSSESDNVLQGNYIGTDVTGSVDLGNGSDGVLIFDSGNLIGGNAAGAGNVISGNDGSGITISGFSATGNEVLGNYIGTNAAGTADLGNSLNGVRIDFGASDNTIGPDNVISGNALAGIDLEAATGNAILGNYIGTNGAGTAAIANGTGVVIENGAADNTIGDAQGLQGNLISGNSLDGILITGAASTDNSIDGNLIGTDHTGAADLGNGGNGVAIANSASGTGIGLSAGNTIAYNTNEGVDVGTGSGHSVRGNSIHSNGDLGIDLGAAGVTENDADDLDSGDNGLQNFPDLTSAVTGSVTVEGTFDSTPSTTFALDFYASASCDASGNGEGETYLGARIVTTDGAGDASFTFTGHQTVTPGTFITATATAPDGSTSEFSDCFMSEAVPAENLAGDDNTPGDCSEGETAQDCAVDGPRGMHALTTGGGGGQGTAAGGSTILYFADTGNDKVKQISPATGTGTVNTVAGTGTAGYNGDGIDPTTAQLNAPRDVYVAPSGDIYIADTDNCLVRRVSGGVIETVAGLADTAPDCGYNGDDMDAVDAQLNFPSGVVVDEDDNLYIADTENCRIRKVDAGGTITTVAGTGACGYTSDRGPATGSQLNRPRDVSILFPDDDLIIADTDNHRIRRVYLPGGGITTIGGTGVAGYDGGATVASSAAVNAPEALQAVNYRVLIADTQNSRIRRIDTLENTITTLVGADGVTSAVALDQPGGVTIVGANESLAWSDTPRHVLETAEIPAGGTTTSTLAPVSTCAILPGTSSIDWLLPAALFGLVLFRRRLGLLFAQLRTSLAPTPAV